MNFFRGTGLKGLIGMDVVYKGIFSDHYYHFENKDILDMLRK
jgi:hypothetical protein